MKKTSKRAIQDHLGSIAMAMLIFVSGCGETISYQNPSSFRDAYNSSIKISLAHPADSKAHDYEMVLAANKEATTLHLCYLKVNPKCEPGQYLFSVDLILTQGNKSFFKTKPGSGALLEEGFTLKAIAADKTGKVIDTRNIQFYKTVAGGQGTPATATGPVAAGQPQGAPAVGGRP